MASRSIRKFKGAYQWWKTPYYVAPVVSPLEHGPDFSFVDGRKIEFTDYYDLKRREKQVELGQRVVQYLAEIKEAEHLYADQVAYNKSVEAHARKTTPRAKGNSDII